MSHSIPAAEPGIGPDPSPKRRKLRKGTTSCWECKRRKVRCSFVDKPEAVCASCQRRGSQCVTQDILVESAQPASQEPNTPATRRATGSRLSPVRNQPDEQPREQLNHRPYAEISRELHANLLSRKDVKILLDVGAHGSISFHGVMMTPYPDLERDGLHDFHSLLQPPPPDAHPVNLATYMFLLATVLQFLDPEKSRRQIEALSEPPRVMMKRLAETAARLVTTRDDLLGTVEGMQCVMMEGMYHANCGNLRPAWMASRRAMALAQLMGIHRSDHCSLPLLNPGHKFDASFLWYRIVSTDRFLCLLLGMPQGSMDRSMAAENALANDTPLGRLERVHCAIASRILERNDAGPASFTMVTIREIDTQLQNAAEMMPSGWWMVPNLGAASSHIEKDNKCKLPDDFWEMLRMVTQLYHYNLLNQLHLPFMLNFSHAERLHDYSQTACVNASREILTRFIAFRSYNRVAYCCRAMDFFTLIAAMLLLIAHLHQHSRVSNELNFLGHQRQGDRAMVDQAVTFMREIGRISEDPVTGKGAELLSQLLDVEAEAAKGRAYSTHSISSPTFTEEELSANPPPPANILHLCVPYFGMVRIAPEGDISKESPPQGALTMRSYRPSGHLDAIVESGSGTTLPNEGSSEFITAMHNQYAIDSFEDQYSGIQNELEPSAALPQSWQGYPGLTAGVDDWALQGVDMAFFDSLMRGSNLFLDENAAVPSD
ncbi:hypothetical protein BJX99DRAFT_264240 [Aspergillus californicus]